MLVFDKAYNEVRSKCIVPLSRYNIRYDSLKVMGIKNLLKSKLNRAEFDLIDNKSFLLYFEQDSLLKGLLADINLIYIKALLQNNDLKLQNPVNISANWNIVTNYYASFCYASLFLRLNFCGNLFLDGKVKSDFEELLSLLLNNRVSISSSNIFFKIMQDKNDEYYMRISPSGSNSHKFVWNEMNNLINELISYSRVNSDEQTVLKSLRTINANLGNCFPSVHRNKVNYQPIYSLYFLENNLYSIDANNKNNSWLKEILYYESNNKQDDNKSSRLLAAYTKYIEIFSEKLISDFFELKGKDNNIVSKINKKKGYNIEIEDFPYSFDI